MADNMSEDLKSGALVYHRLPKPGKLEIQATKPLGNQRDLALAYSPGVAAACMAIHDDPQEAATLTIRQNLVAVLTNGTAEQIADLFAADATVEDPIGADIRNTREQLVEFYSIITGMDEHVATLNWKKIAGDTAVFEFTLVTGTADMRFEITPIDIMVFDADGKISSMRAVSARSSSIFSGMACRSLSTLPASSAYLPPLSWAK